jgi:hypothetical protein
VAAREVVDLIDLERAGGVGERAAVGGAQRVHVHLIRRELRKVKPGRGSIAAMPWLLCLACRSWTLRWAWRPADGQRVPFVIRCPCCDVSADVSAVPMRLRPPEGAEDERRTAALALRVYRAVAGAA